MKPKTKSLITGIPLLAAGVAVVAFNSSGFSGGFAKLWPFAVTLLGLVACVFFFSTRKKKDRPGLIFLGSFLLVSSVLLFILSLGSYQYIRVLWPGFIGALGLGFLSVYLTGDRKKAMYALALFLVGAAILIWIFFSLRSQYGLVIGVSLFVIGVGFLTRSLMKEIET